MLRVADHNCARRDALFKLLDNPSFGGFPPHVQNQMLEGLATAPTRLHAAMSDDELVDKYIQLGNDPQIRNLVPIIQGDVVNAVSKIARSPQDQGIDAAIRMEGSIEVLKDFVTSPAFHMLPTDVQRGLLQH
jgi:hypothetical protein